MINEIEERYKAQRLQFVQTLVGLVAFHEWDDKLLAEVEEMLSWGRGYSFVLFPSGVKGVIEYFEAWQDDLMLETLNKIVTPDKIREKIALALKIRIKNLVPKIIHNKNCRYYIRPENAIFGTEIALQTCNKIWYYAGDKSTDFNYYTKRGLLLSVYLSSIMFYINDESEEHIKTDKFIKQALENIINLASIKNRIKLPAIKDIPILRLFS